MKIKYILFFLFLSAGLLHAQIKDVTLQTKSVLKYDKAEFAIQLIETWTNPYLQEEVALDMAIVTPSGKKLSLPCYFESGESGKISNWKARFTPQEVGKYRYSFKLSRDGKLLNTSTIQTFRSKASKKNGFLHPKNNWVFQFDNGKPYRGIGENLCWESRANDDSKYFKDLHQQDKYNYEEMLPLLASNGGNFYRTWMCSWNLPLEFKRGFNNNRYTESDEYYNPSAIKKFDRMVCLADSLDLRIMLTLGQGSNGERNGVRPSNDDFFVNLVAKARYKNRMRYIVGRWGYSTSICAWELFNEIDNVQFRDNNNPISTEVIVKWHDEMSSYIKQIDPYGHMITTSISHRDLKGLNSLKNMDFNQKHIYKNTGSIPSQIVQYETEYKKPYVIGEFGFEWDWSKNFNDFAEGMDVDFKRGLWYGLFSPTPILPLSWWWEFFENRGLTSYFKGVRAITDQMLTAGKGEFQPVTVQAGALDAYGVKCGKQVFIYLFNGTSQAVCSDLKLELKTTDTFKLQHFIPSTGQYQDIKNQTLIQPYFTFKLQELKPNDEIVFILTPVR